MITKFAQIVDQPHERFGLQYQDTLGRKNTMRLDAITYEAAVSEAKSFLGINRENFDDDGNTWEIQ